MKGVGRNLNGTDLVQLSQNDYRRCLDNNAYAYVGGWNLLSLPGL